jgi:organizing structure protein 2
MAQARLAVHSQAARLEDSFNALASRAFKVEHNLTSTIASLAPARQSGETVLPGAIYVLVAAMGTSILARNRNILIRASLPVAVGIGAANYLLPVTSKNVGELIWEYEKKVPALANAHEKYQERITKFVHTGISHSKMGAGMLEDKIADARKSMEGWVSKGT